MLAQHVHVELRLAVRGPEAAVVQAVQQALPAGAAVAVVGRSAAMITMRVGVGGLAAETDQALARAVVQRGFELLELQREHGSLEDVFRKLTLPAQQEALHA